MKPQTIEVLSDAVNRAVVRMPGRRFPGLVVQGDRLIYLCSLARNVVDRAKILGDAELTRLAGNLCFELLELSTHLANVSSAAQPEDGSQ